MIVQVRRSFDARFGLVVVETIFLSKKNLKAPIDVVFPDNAPICCGNGPSMTTSALSYLREETVSVDVGSSRSLYCVFTSSFTFVFVIVFVFLFVSVLGDRAVCASIYLK